MALASIEQVRSIDWGQGFLWDVLVPEAPAPFNNWFPAVEVEEELTHLTPYKFEAHISGFSVPKNTDTKLIKLTFHDDSKNTLSNWIQNWVNVTIFNNGLSVSALEDSIKIIQLIKLNRQREQISVVSYHVYPEGSLSYIGNSSPEAHRYSQQFVIVGKEVG